ncbi:TPA: cell filamentation protein Fic, partial [Pseudomonas aeruginosa]
MHSLTPEYLTALRFDGTQAATLRALGEYQGKQQLYAAQSPEALKGLRQIAVVESTESSNRLEGVVVAPSRLKSLVIRNAAPKSRSEQEIAGYRD